MNNYPLHALDGTAPAGFLAALGMARSAPPGTRVAYEGATPVLHSDLEADQIAESTAAELGRTTTPESLPFPDDMRTTVPLWSVMAGLAEQTWDDPGMDEATGIFDYGSINGVKPGPDPKVKAGSLIMFSGKSHLRTSLQDLWPLSVGRKAAPVERVRAEQTQQLRHDLLALLAGGYPRSVPTGNALRYTAAEISPRLRSGTESTITTPCVELLAYRGATALLAHQIGTTATGQERAGMTWALNPVPLTPASVVAIHEQQAAPSSWTRYTTVKTSIGGGTKASYFGDTRLLEKGV